MGYSNKTPNFGLPQYALGDIPQVNDFNNAFGTIDQHLGQGGGAVESVNGQTGAVVLDAGDVGAIADSDGAVSTANLADKSVTAEKIADGSITAEKIAEGIVIGGGGAGSAAIYENLVITPESFVSFTGEDAEEQKLIDLGYFYRAALVVIGATEKMSPTVTFSLADIKNAGVEISNQYRCYNGGVYIYADGIPSADITVLTLALHGGENSGEGNLGDGFNIISNPNLLDNWYFANPINQKGQTEYAGGGYGIDRWVHGRAIIKTEDDGVSFSWNGDTSVAENLHNAFFSQRFEPDFIKGGQHITVSVLLTGGQLLTASVVMPEAGSSNLSFNMGELTIALSNSTSLQYLSFYSYTTEKYTLIAAKLELGDRQTLARQDENGNWVLIDPPPDYGTELAKCQRYMIVGGISGVWQTSGVVFFPIPTQMRTTPTAIGNVSAHTVSNNTEITNVKITSLILRNNGIQARVSGASEPVYLNLQGFDANL